MSTLSTSSSDNTASIESFSDLNNSFRSDEGSEIFNEKELWVNPRTKGSINPLQENVQIISSYVKEDIKQRWNGVVLSCDELTFTTRITDVTKPSNPDEIVDIDIDEIEPRDRKLIQTGAVFIWQIGYRAGTKVSRQNFSSIRFRRLPKWTENEIVKADTLAKQYFDLFSTTE